MDCTYLGHFRIKHFKKRRLIGSERERALNFILNEQNDPSVYIREQAKMLMKEGKKFKLIIH